MSDILKIKMKCEDVPKAKTIGDYLCALLCGVWEDGESFSGKRPFGNSGWEYDLYIPLIKNAVVDGKLDSDGYIKSLDEEAAHDVILKAIKQVFKDAQK